MNAPRPLTPANTQTQYEITEKDLPRINPFKLLKLKKTLLEQINNIPPYYKMYPGRDQSVPDKESILDPKFPRDY